MSTAHPNAAALVDTITKNWAMPPSALFDTDILPSENEDEWALPLLVALADLSAITIVEADGSGHLRFEEARDALTRRCENRQEQMAYEGDGYLGLGEAINADDVEIVIERMGGRKKVEMTRQEAERVMNTPGWSAQQIVEASRVLVPVGGRTTNTTGGLSVAAGPLSTTAPSIAHNLGTGYLPTVPPSMADFLGPHAQPAEYIPVRTPYFGSIPSIPLYTPTTPSLASPRQNPRLTPTYDGPTTPTDEVSSPVWPLQYPLHYSPTYSNPLTLTYNPPNPSHPLDSPTYPPTMTPAPPSPSDVFNYSTCASQPALTAPTAPMYPPRLPSVPRESPIFATRVPMPGVSGPAPTPPQRPAASPARPIAIPRRIVQRDRTYRRLQQDLHTMRARQRFEQWEIKKDPVKRKMWDIEDEKEDEEEERKRARRD